MNGSKVKLLKHYCKLRNLDYKTAKGILKSGDSETQRMWLTEMKTALKQNGDSKIVHNTK